MEIPECCPQIHFDHFGFFGTFLQVLQFLRGNMDEGERQILIELKEAVMEANRILYALLEKRDLTHTPQNSCEELLLDRIRWAGKAGITQTEISKKVRSFGPNRRKEALRSLEERGVIRSTTDRSFSTKGRTTYFYNGKQLQGFLAP